MMATEHGNEVIEISRRNGWSLPLHSLQLCGWLAVMYFVFIYFTTMAPTLPSDFQAAAHVANGLTVFVLCIAMIVATTINPADSTVLRKSQLTVVQLDLDIHRQTIQTQHCYLCQVNVAARSKHCRACNKCVAQFDHHCKWLNNCVGKRNYRWFLSSLVSGILGSLLIVIVGLLQFISFFAGENRDYILKPYASNCTDAHFYIVNQEVSKEAWLSVTGITTLLALVSLFLLLHLLIFHLWLFYKGMTTYEYIVRMRGKRREQDAKSQAVKLSDTVSSYQIAPTKSNKVTPFTDESKTSSDTLNPSSSQSAQEENRHGQDDVMKDSEYIKKIPPPPSTSVQTHSLEHITQNTCPSLQHMTAVRRIAESDKLPVEMLSSHLGKAITAVDVYDCSKQKPLPLVPGQQYPAVMQSENERETCLLHTSH